jgi:hypothetical protein
MSRPALCQVQAHTSTVLVQPPSNPATLLSLCVLVNAELTATLHAPHSGRCAKGFIVRLLLTRARETIRLACTHLHSKTKYLLLLLSSVNAICNPFEMKDYPKVTKQQATGRRDTQHRLRGLTVASSSPGRENPVLYFSVTSTKARCVGLRWVAGRR